MGVFLVSKNNHTEEKKMKISQLMGVINQKEGRGHTEKMSSASFEIINIKKKKKNSC